MRGAAWRLWAIGAVSCLQILCGTLSASATPPLVLHTAGYQAPVRGGPGDLLIVAGYGFEATDSVVYEAAELPAQAGRSGKHPLRVPDAASATLGIAPIVKLADPPYALTVRLPDQMRPLQAYRLWVVNAAGEWSAAMWINDPRPQWITPSFVHATADPAHLGRRLRVVGRNLEPATHQPMQIRLQGPATYLLTANGPASLQHYVAEASLPARLVPGVYSVGVSPDGLHWIAVPAQELEVRADPAVRARFGLDEDQFGACRPDDEADDAPCLSRAIDAAVRAGGGVVEVPRGVWDVWNPKQFTLPRGVDLLGPGDRSSTIVRHGAADLPPPAALFTLTGNNSITGLTFSDADRIESNMQSRTVLQLGSLQGSTTPGAAAVTDVVISENSFHRVGRAISDSGRPIARLFVTRNEFAAYGGALELGGNRFNVTVPYRIDDSVVRDNRFVPGSYLDIAARQGTLASELGASFRVDFSSNVADGTSIEGLQDPTEPKGWRAAFFWNMTNSNEQLLVAENHISCSGDKVGDGEALAFDGNVDTFAFNGAQAVTASRQDSVVVRGTLLSSQNDRPIDRATYYLGHWIQIVEGPGLGQARRIEAYSEDPRSGTVTFRVSPQWDVMPSEHGSRLIVGRELWQMYVVGNEIDHRKPPCVKANLTAPRGGGIVVWAGSADSAIEGNRQYDSNGILFNQMYSAPSPSCASCSNWSMIQSGLDIRGNLIEGEYDWDSACSWSGITGSFAAGPAPEWPPPTLGFGVTIAHNTITHADGFRGGAIDITATWFRGPPGEWPLVQSLAIFGNTISEIAGPAPRAGCGSGQRARVGIRLEGPGNVKDAVLYDNRCWNVDTALDDGGRGTRSVCPRGQAAPCQCGGLSSSPK